MIEVIKRGQVPEEMVYNAVCGHCSSVLRFKRSEASYMSDQRDGDYLTVECPVCTHKVTTTVAARRIDYAAQFVDNPRGWKD